MRSGSGPSPPSFPWAVLEAQWSAIDHLLDVVDELRVESVRGIAAHFRFRIYVLPGERERYLGLLRERNREIATHVERLAEEAQARPRARRSRRI